MERCDFCIDGIPGGALSCPECGRPAEVVEAGADPLGGHTHVGGDSNPLGGATRVGSAATEAPQQGLIAGRYQVLRTLGEGAFGTVHQVIDQFLTDKPVRALKVLSGEVDPQELAREAEVATEIQHPNLVRVRHHGSDGDRHFLVMEYCDEGDLYARLRGQGMRLPIEEALAITDQVLAGLSELHGRQILHLDIKPGNVLFGRGQAKLADFGIARGLRHSGADRQVAGTPGYMPPEQVEGRELDTRTDLYAVGVLLHVMLTGQLPKGGLAPGVPESLRPALQRCLSSRPADRPATAQELRALLRGEASGGFVWQPLSPTLSDRLSSPNGLYLLGVGLRGESVVRLEVMRSVLEELLGQQVLAIQGWGPKGLVPRAGVCGLVLAEQQDLLKRWAEQAKRSPIAASVSELDSGRFRPDKALKDCSSPQEHVLAAAIRASFLANPRKARTSLESARCTQDVEDLCSEVPVLADAIRVWRFLDAEDSDDQVAYLLDAARDMAEDASDHLELAWVMAALGEGEAPVREALTRATELAKEDSARLAVAWAAMGLGEVGIAQAQARALWQRAAQKRDLDSILNAVTALTGILDDESQTATFMDGLEQGEMTEELARTLAEVWGWVGRRDRAEAMERRGDEIAEALARQQAARAQAEAAKKKAEAERRAAEHAAARKEAEARKAEQAREDAAARKREEQARRKAEAAAATKRAAEAAEAARRAAERAEKKKADQAEAARRKEAAAERKRMVMAEAAIREREEERERARRARTPLYAAGVVVLAFVGVVAWVMTDEDEEVPGPKDAIDFTAGQPTPEDHLANEPTLVRSNVRNCIRATVAGAKVDSWEVVSTQAVTPRIFDAELDVATRSNGPWRALVHWDLDGLGLGVDVTCEPAATSEATTPKPVAAPVAAEPEPPAELPEREPEAPEPEPVEDLDAALAELGSDPPAEEPEATAEPEAEPEPPSAYPDVTGKWRGTHDGESIILTLKSAGSGAITGYGQRSYLGPQVPIGFEGRISEDGRLTGIYTFLDDPSMAPVTITAALSGTSLSGSGLSLRKD